MDEKLKGLLEMLKPYGYTEESLMLAQAMKNMKDTGYGNILELPITPGQTVGAAYKIDRSNFAWTWLFYCYLPENTGLEFDFSIDVVYNQDRRSFKGPIPAPASMFGNPRLQLWKRNNPPVVFGHNTTVNVTLTNNFAAPLADPVRIAVFLMGNEEAIL